MQTSDSSERPDDDGKPARSPSPTVSVVTSAFNVAPYIREAILSALEQTFSDLEVIVVDDGSTDGTLDRLQDITDPRLRLLKRPHRGQAAGINAAVAEARGAYVALLDGDDVWLPEKLERHIALHREYPDADVTYSGSREIDAEGNTGGLLLASDRRRVSFRDLLVENPIHNGSVPVVRREALRQAGLFDTALTACHDFDMWVRVAQLRKDNIVGFSEPLTLYRRHPHQTSANVDRMAKGWSEVIAKAARTAPDEVNNTEPARRVNLNRYFAYVCYQTRQFGRTLRYLSRGLLSSPVRFVADRRNLLLAVACLSGIVLPRTLHESLQRRMRERYDRTALERAQRAV